MNYIKFYAAVCLYTNGLTTREQFTAEWKNAQRRQCPQRRPAIEIEDRGWTSVTRTVAA